MLRCKNKTFNKFLFFSSVFFVISFLINTVVVSAVNEEKTQVVKKNESLRDFAVFATVAGVIFWIQSANDPKFKEIESKIQLLRQDVAQIRENNSKILRIVGRLEGKIENRSSESP